MISCSKCGSRVGVTGLCKVCASVIHGEGCFQIAQRKAIYGHKDWIQWRDEIGSHAAPVTRSRLAAMLESNVTSWTLISANDGVPMKGFPFLASNMMKQMDMGYVS